MKKKLLNIGLDIGITSVGWSLIDEDNNYQLDLYI